MNAKERMYQRIETHGQELNAIFHTGLEPVELCKKLFGLENQAHHATTCLCNTGTLTILELNQHTGYKVQQAMDDEVDNFFEKILNKVNKLLNNKNVDIFVNRDPRGYALKIRDYDAKNLKIYTDWGGYGIIAPDFKEV